MFISSSDSNGYVQLSASFNRVTELLPKPNDVNYVAGIMLEEMTDEVDFKYPVFVTGARPIQLIEVMLDEIEYNFVVMMSREDWDSLRDRPELIENLSCELAEVAQ